MQDFQRISTYLEFLGWSFSLVLSNNTRSIYISVMSNHYELVSIIMNISHVHSSLILLFIYF